jgi:hypothetical protein
LIHVCAKLLFAGRLTMMLSLLYYPSMVQASTFTEESANYYYYYDKEKVNDGGKIFQLTKVRLSCIILS